MKSTDTPSSQSERTSRCTSVLAPTSIPRVGSSRISSRGPVSSQRASSTFCWLPPLSVPTTCVRVGRTDVERLDPLGDQLVLLAAGDRPRPAAAGLEREDDVLAHRQLLDEPLRRAGSRGRTRCRGSSSSAGCAPRPARRRSRAARSRPGRRRTGAGPPRCGRSRAGRRGRRPLRLRGRGRTARSRACGETAFASSTGAVGVALGRSRSARRSSASSVSSSRPSIFETSSARGSSAVGHSPTSCPLRRTVIRSAISYTCSRKCEMKTIAIPRSFSRRMS